MLMGLCNPCNVIGRHFNFPLQCPTVHDGRLLSKHSNMSRKRDMFVRALRSLVPGKFGALLEGQCRSDCTLLAYWSDQSWEKISCHAILPVVGPHIPDHSANFSLNIH